MTNSPHLPAVVPTHAVPSLHSKRPEVPALLRDAGDAAVFVWDEFFAGQLRNKHTRKAYRRAVTRFLAWLEPTGVPLVRLTPGMVGDYLDALPLSATSKKVELAALRRFFDVLTVRHVLVLNPALSVRGERVSAGEGLSPRIPPADARTLLRAIDPSTPVGLRDRAVLACLVFTAARVGAVARLTRGSLRPDGTHYQLQFLEKNGKVRDIPVRAELEDYLLAYLAAAGLADAAANTPLFRTADGKSGRLTAKGMTGGDIWRLMKRKLLAAGLHTHYSPHSFRSTVATDLLEQNVALTDVQHLLGHVDPRTTRLYDRRLRQVTRNIVERIGV